MCVPLLVLAYTNENTTMGIGPKGEWKLHKHMHMLQNQLNQIDREISAITAACKRLLSVNSHVADLLQKFPQLQIRSILLRILPAQIYSICVPCEFTP